MIWLLICSVTQTSANMAFVFIIWSYFAAQKNTRLNYTHYFIMKIPNKQELKQIAIKHSSAIDFKDSGGGGLKFSTLFFWGGVQITVYWSLFAYFKLNFLFCENISFRVVSWHQIYIDI